MYIRDRERKRKRKGEKRERETERSPGGREDTSLRGEGEERRVYKNEYRQNT